MNRWNKLRKQVNDHGGFGLNLFVLWLLAIIVNFVCCGKLK